ncbi:hypothetical protein [Pelagibacterium lacus]|nr:hypothetical protein [Pelagibacterium lacus]
MRYPLWAFLFVFVVPPFALHAVLAGKAGFEPAAAEMRLAAAEPPPSIVRHRF